MGYNARQVLLLFGLAFVATVHCQRPNILTPTYFNVAEGKGIDTTATCGEGFSQPGERYCKLTGNTADVIRPGEQEIIQGQYCDYCLETDPVKYHPINQAIDGTEKWWQSPPLSRGLHYNEVNITLDLGQLYHVAYIIIKSANSPRPGRFILERSRDYGETYQPWQYFAESESDCFNAFGLESVSSITHDDDVICTDEYSDIVPLEDGEIVVSLVNGRPGSNNFSYSETLQEWTKATNIRLRLLRTNTLLGHLIGLGQQDPTVTRRYYYSIKDISVGGRCVCNGHADTCDTPGFDGRLICTCSHNTCGTECETCCPGFIQKRWRPATLESAHECEPCNCHGHSDECEYDEEVARNRQSLDIYGNYEGGGVCSDCQHNTTGINCELCMSGYYRDGEQPLDSPNVCLPCDCDPYFSTGNCAPITGHCECRPQFSGPDCGTCSDGYYDFPYCKPCECNVNGTANKVCQSSGGMCPCKSNYIGHNCDMCAPGYYNFPECLPCECDRDGSVSPYCHPDTGDCTCRARYQNRTCGECETGYFNFPSCQACECTPEGVTGDICEKSDGSCICMDNFDGPSCERCEYGHYSYPNCYPCNCDPEGSDYVSCYEDGQCYCNPGFAGQKCDRCGDGFFRYPDCLACNCSRDGARSLVCDDPNGQCDCRDGYQSRTCEICDHGFYNYPNCEECNCNPAGVIDIPGEPLGGCGHSTQGACMCKENVQGRACDVCAPQHFNLARSNPAGCEPCDCFRDGTIGGLSVCDMTTGQCLCKAAVEGRRCDVCRDGYYMLRGDNTFGCVECGCDVGGSIHGICDKETGQCICRPRIEGRTCKMPAQLHFFPSLHQIKFEIESGYIPDGSRPRIGFSSDEFPGFSYLGYAVMSPIQPTVLVDINVDRSSIYRVVIRYLYEGSVPVKGRLSLLPSSDRLGSEQESDILFIPGPDPQFVTVEGAGIVRPFVLNPGEWTVTIDAPDGALLDYLVLLPSAFYEATVLIQSVADPCIATQEQDRCNYYVYPSMDTYPSARGTEGYYYDVSTNQQIQIRQLGDEYLRNELDVIDLAVIDEEQDNLGVSIPIDEAGDYIFIVEYYGGSSEDPRATFDVFDGDKSSSGFINFYNCSYLCRSIVVNDYGEVHVFTFEEPGDVSARLNLVGDAFFLAVSTITAIPVDEFSYELITPTLECIKSSTGECLGSIYPIPPDSTLIDFTDPTGEAPDPPNVFNPSTTYYYLSPEDKEVVVEIDFPPPGTYVFVIHYYQPYSTGFDVDFRIPGEFDAEGSFNAEYCPHVSGCRVVVALPDMTNNIDLTGQGQSIQFNVPDGDTIELWIDYVLAIPSDVYDDDILMEIALDRAGDFITYCANDEFYVNVEAPEVCQQGVFSISTDFNNGAFPCDCNAAGSTSFMCEEIAGQCPCRDNVVGRQCDRCAIGYYGFPNCRACNCPNNICNEDNGACICPENVIGAVCDQCAPGTYGFDPLVGCVECECDERGSEGSTSICNADTGQCRCRENVGGRRCDQCMDGFYQFPFCLACDCDPAGTLPQICDQTSAQCLCKDNAVGSRCDQCAIGSFNLDAENSQGCISCFCFGVTDDCKSYTRQRHPVDFQEEWSVTNLEDPLVRYTGSDLVNVYVHGKGSDPNIPIYWIPPPNWFGSKLNSYGGYLRYRVHNNPLPTSPYQSLRRPDVVIRGNGITVSYSNFEQPQPSRSLSVDIKMVEDNFQYSSSSRTVTREDFLMVLANIDYFQIRAQYFDNILDASLSEVSLEITRRDGQGEKATTVERCKCPPEYTGLSCEQCAPGHYRIGRGTFLGQCVPCQCNNHTNECDPETGYCLDCADNTEGAQCQTCKSGYRGNGTLGTANDCEMCACPEAIESRNFAYTCDVNSDFDLVCDCFEGHTGRYCERCAEGYYGDPSRPYGRCQRCHCSGNTDFSRPGPECDSLFGICLKCTLETTGDGCELCNDWYYGDAVYLKNCQTCDCDRYGSESCNRTTGECVCKPNVVGERCDQCAAYHYNFESGVGCEPCGCGVASTSFDCDIRSGKCECQVGVDGDKCDKCAEGYYGYSRFGCQVCSCPPKLRCDPVDGECICPPGATGPRCDQCADRYVLTDAGCLPCDDCVHELLDVLDRMSESVDADSGLRRNVSVGVQQMERLNEINATMREVREQMERMEVYNNGMGMKVSNGSEDLDSVKSLARKINKQGTKTDLTSQEVIAATNGTLERARSISEKINRTYSDIKEKAKMSSSGSNASLELDEMLAKAEKILEEIRSRNHSQSEIDAETELTAAKELLEQALSLRNSSQDLLGRLYNVSDSMTDFSGKIEELQNLTTVSELNADGAQAVINKNYSAVLQESQYQVTSLNNLAQAEVNDGQDLIEAADLLLADARTAVQLTAGNASTLDAAINKLDTKLGELQSALNETSDVVDEATEHAANLTEAANLLEGLLVSTKELAENALNAANAYSDIVSAIEDAEVAALNAKNASSLAENRANSFGEQPAESLTESEKLVKKAEKAKKRLDGVEEDLNAASLSVDEAMGKLDTATDDLAEIERGMMAIPSPDSECEIQVCGEGDPSCKPGFMGENCNVAELSEQALDAKMQAMDASTRAEAAAVVITAITQQLPFMEELVTITIPDNIDQANIEANEAQDKVTEGREIIRNFGELEQTLLDRHTTLLNISNKVLGNLEELREKIDFARTVAQGIQVAARLEADSILQLRTPQVVDDIPQTATSISMYFLTAEPDGLLFYGAAPNPEDGYVALEMVDGVLVFKYNLGDADVSVPLTDSVADGQWHQLVAERIGRYGQLTVFNGDGTKQIATAESKGVLTLLDFANDWGLFVGGVLGNYTLPDAVSSNAFVGGIDEILFNQIPLGIWNFEAAINVDEGIARNVTDLSVEVDPNDVNSVLFDGNGYMQVPNPSATKLAVPMSLAFKSQVPDGLLMFGRKKSDYLAIELMGGRVVLRVSIDGETRTLRTNRRYDNGRWTTVSVNKFGPIELSVNQGTSNQEVLSEEFETDAAMQPFKYLYFGGLVGIRDDLYPSVTRRRFLGCLKEVYIFRDAVDLLSPYRSKGIYPSCIPQDTRLVSFPAPYGGYVKLMPTDFFTTGDLSLNFRAQRPSGLIAYLADENHENVVVIQLVDGRVEAVVGKETTVLTRLLSNEDGYADGEWHTVTVSKPSNREVSLAVDETDMTSDYFRTRTSVVVDGFFFVGGLPAGLDYNTDAVTDLQPFVGCISDVSVGITFMNFAERIGDFSAEYTLCPEEAEVFSAPPPDRKETTPAPGPEAGECSLGLLGSSAQDPLDTGAGFFGATNESRYEFESLGRDYTTKDEMTFGLKTAAEYGVLYFTSDARGIDFTSLFLEDGYLVYKFDYGSGPVTIRSSDKVNNNQWIRVRTMRDGTHGDIFVDDVNVGNGVLTGSSRYLSVATPLYVGGIPLDQRASDIPDPSRVSLIGCIKDFTVKPPRALISEFEVPQCQGSREPGVFFGQYGGYLVLENRFSVGVNMEIDLEIKPRQTTGTIFSVQKPRMDFMSLEMRAGALYLTIQNGGGAFTATFTPDDGEFSLCDGEWHQIKAVKEANEAYIEVDGVRGRTIVGAQGSTEANTNNALYFGGLPIEMAHDGILENEHYVGCMRNAVINGVDKALGSSRFSGDVDVRSCPAN